MNEKIRKKICLGHFLLLCIVNRSSNPVIYFQVWLCILSSCIFMGSFIYIFTRWFDNIFSYSPRKLSLSEIYWFIYGAILRQGSTIDPKSSSKCFFSEVSCFSDWNSEFRKVNILDEMSSHIRILKNLKVICFPKCICQ